MAVWAIFRRELKSYLISPATYVASVAFLAVAGYLFSVALLATQAADMRPFFLNLGVVLLFVTPLLTMRLLAEERQNRTDELLFTLPVTPAQIVAGKYLAALTLYGALLAATGAYPAILSTLADPAPGPIATGYVGALLLGGAFLAAGVFASAVSGSQVSAGFLGFGLLLLMWVVNWLSVAALGPATRAARALDVLGRFDDFARGLLDSSNAAFYLSAVGLFLFFSARALQRRGSALLATFVLGSAVLANVLAARYPLRVDLSPERRFGLSSLTRQVLAHLEQPVHLYGFVTEGEEADWIRDLLRGYRLASGRVEVHLVDPEQQPALAREMEVRAPGTVVVEVGGRRRKIEYFNLFDLDPETGVHFRGEQAVTRALIELSGRPGANVYFLEGHGEGSPLDEYAELRSYLEGEGLTVKSLNLAVAGGVPADARIVVAAGPKADLAAEEREMLERFVAAGGRLALWLDPPQSARPMPELDSLVASLGVETLPGLVVDPGRAFFGDPLTPVPELRWHAITGPLIQANLAVALPGARPVKPAAHPAGGPATPQGGLTPEVVPLLVSTSRARAEPSPDPAATFQGRTPGKGHQEPGPLALGVAVQRTRREPAVVASAGEVPPSSSEGAAAEGGAAGSAVPVAVVVGDSSFARNASMAFPGNRELAANMLMWLADRGDLVSIRPRVATAPRVVLTGAQAAAIFYGTSVAMPAALAAVGLLVWWRRRSL